MREVKGVVPEKKENEKQEFQEKGKNTKQGKVKHVRQGFQDYSIATFIERLKSKVKEYGTKVYPVSSAYTSQKYSCCGTVKNLLIKKKR